MILIGIAATYTPIAAIGLDGSTALIPAVSVTVGWTALAVIPALWSHLGGPSPSPSLCSAGSSTHSVP